MSQSMVRIEIQLVLLVTLLIAIAMWAYQGTTDNLFVWDSTHYLLKQENHLSSLNFENISWMATSLEVYNWHPLTWFSWAIDYQIYGGFNPWGYHLSSNLLHSINGVLVFFVILTIFGLLEPESGNFSIGKDAHSLIAAFLASTLFIVHPQHVESVAWVAERKDLLVQFFMLLSFLLYVGYITCDRQVKTRWYIATLVFFFLAVISKPMAVTFPVVLLLADIYPLRRTVFAKPVIDSIQQQSFYRLVIEKIPFLLLSLILALATLMAQETAVVDVSLFPRVLNAVNSTILYLEKFVIPVSLNPHYPHLKVDGGINTLRVILVLLAFSGITLAVFLAWRKQRRAWLISWLFFLVTLSPVLGLIQVGGQGAADRYAYFPTLPLYFLLAGGILWVLQTGSTFRKATVLMIALVVISLFVFQTRKQISVWQSEFSLWSQVVKLDPDNVFAQNNLGIVYKNMGDYENAAIHFEAGGIVNSGRNSMHAWRAVTFMHLSQFEDAITELVNLGTLAEMRSMLEVDSNCIQYNIGWSYARLKQYQESKELFERIDPDSNIGPDAIAWLNALSELKSQADETMLNKELPGICENLIPAINLVKSVR